MSVNIPSTQEIQENIVNDIEAKIGQTVPILPKAFIRVLAWALAGVFTILYKFGAWLSRQIFPQTADEEYLLRWGELLGLSPSEAVQAQLQLEITGIDGNAVPAAQEWVGPNNLTYTTILGATIAGGTGIIEVESLTEGELGNLVAGDILTIVNPITGVDTTATVLSVLIPGADAQTLESFRQTVLLRFRKPPQGGAIADYYYWSVEVPEVTRALVYSGLPGQVIVYPITDNSTSRIPTAAVLTAVEDSINLPDRRPITAFVTVLPPFETSFDVNITNLQVDTPANRALIETKLTEYFLEREPFIYGLSNVNKATINFYEVSSILTTLGFTFDSVEVVNSAAPLLPFSTYTLGQGELAVVGLINFV